MRDKIAIVTGANGKLGRNFIKELNKLGYKSYALDIVNNSIEVDELAKFVNVDITDEIQVSNFFSSLENIDILVNNAGIGVFTPFEMRTTVEFKKVMEVNLLGTFLMSQYAIKIMKKQRSGKIINIASVYGCKSSDERIYGKSGRNNSEVYTATKAGVIALTKYMSAHFAKYNIQVNSISPGGIFNDQSEDFVNNYIYKTPSQKMGTENDLNGIFKLLISDESSYINGQNIAVDGGFLAW